MTALRSGMIVILLMAVAMMGFGCSSNEPPSQLSGVKKEGQAATMEQKDASAGSAAQQQTAQMPKAVEISGTVEQSGDGIVIATDLGKYNVIGQDLTDLVGKTVKVTGAVEESAGQYTIKVLSVEETH